MLQIDVARALQALDGNEELLRDLAKMFAEDAPVLMEQLKCALVEKRSTQVRSFVHSLKGLVGTFYASSGVEIAQRLEDASARGDLSLFDNGELEQLQKTIQSIMLDFSNLGWTVLSE